MNKNRCIFPSVHVETCGLTIATIWDVCANRSYNIPIDKSRRDSASFTDESGEGGIMIRTHSGHGRISLASGREVEIGPETIFLTEFENIRRYRCADESWCFWWFEIYSLANLHIPTDSELRCPRIEGEERRFESLTRDIRSSHPKTIHRAAAQLIKMIYDWWAVCEESEPCDPKEEAVRKVIDLMHSRIGAGLGAQEMAVCAGMSETGFRKAFKRVTGKNPKAYYDNLRLHTALQLLRQGYYNVGDVAEQTGFDNQFYFSKVFKEHFGVPPSRI